jgi:hypothetical protein
MCIAAALVWCSVMIVFFELLSNRTQMDAWASCFNSPAILTELLQCSSVHLFNSDFILERPYMAHILAN